MVTLNLKGDHTGTEAASELLAEVKREMYSLFGIVLSSKSTATVALDQLQFLSGPLSETGVVDGIEGKHVHEDWVSFIHTSTPDTAACHGHPVRKGSGQPVQGP